MGTRPKISVVIGIADADMENDPRRTQVPTEVIDENELEYYVDEEGYSDRMRTGLPEFDHPGVLLDQIIYNPKMSNEYCVGNVTGYIYKEGKYDDDIIRALCLFFPEFREDGFKVFPDLEKSEHGMVFRHYGYDDWDIKCHRFIDSVFENMPSITREYWKRTLFYLKQCGWDLREDELHFILVWDWS